MPERVKDISEHNKKVLAGVDDDLRGFFTELQSKYETNLYLTSGKRDEGQGRHSHGQALDFRSRGYEHLYSDLMNTEWGLSLMNKYGVGILDETDPETLKKTGGTGAHFHIGKDSTLTPKVKQRYEDLKAGRELEPLIAYAAKDFAQTPSVNQTSDIRLPSVNFAEIDANEAIRSYRSYQEIEAGLVEEKETSEKMLQKQQNTAIKRLTEKQKQREQFISEISKLNPIVEQKRTATQQQTPSLQAPQVDIQQQMPSLFKLQ